MSIKQKKRYSVLNNFKNGIYKSKPYPYIIIDNALPWNYYEELNKTFPLYKDIINDDLVYQRDKKILQNNAYRMSAVQALNHKKIPNIWKDFIIYHSSYNFAKEVFNVFEKDLYKFYPRLKYGLPKDNHCKIRYTSFQGLDGKLKKTNIPADDGFSLDCQFVINTPTKTESSVIEPHLDNPREFYAGLFYMRNKDDNSKGGNLCSYEFKKGHELTFHGKLRVKEDKLNLIDEIEYKENRLLLFINTIWSVHGVSKKSESDSFRKYMNIIGEFPFRLFDFKK